MLIVLSGEAGAGKDAIARVLCENHGWVPYSLSGPLKRFGADMFGFSDKQLYGPSRCRNEPDPRWARPCDQCCSRQLTLSDDGQRLVCAACRGSGRLNDNSPRRIFQLLGDEYLRQMIHPDALTLRARPDIERMLSDGTSVVVNDARFSNDRDNLHRWLGAHRVDVTRMVGDKPVDAPWRHHGSELDRPTRANVEYVLAHDEEWPYPGLPARVVEMLQQLTSPSGTLLPEPHAE